VQTGLGLGMQGLAELGLGVRKSWKGILTTRRLHCSKTSIPATAPQPPPLEMNIYIFVLPPPRHRPNKTATIRSNEILFVRYLYNAQHILDDGGNPNWRLCYHVHHSCMVVQALEASR
jgi:hypothetical protein